MIENSSHIKHYGACESTQIHGTGNDILGTTRHIEMWRDDLEMIRLASIDDLRYSVPWHRIEQRRGTIFAGSTGP